MGQLRYSLQVAAETFRGKPPIVKFSTPEAIIENILHLVSLPDIYLRLQKVLDDPKHNRLQVSDIVSFDPSLSVRILRIANSSYYGFPGSIDSISAAINIIGEIELRNIVLAATVMKTMGKLEDSPIDINAFWLHSVHCGVTARLIGQLVDGCNANDLFLCGMLHDLGILILYHNEAELTNSVLIEMRDRHRSRDQAERSLLGFDHALLGGLLARSWGLTPMLQEVISNHHHPDSASEYLLESQILCLANLFTQSDFEVFGFLADTDSESRILAEKRGIDSEILPELLGSALKQCNEIKNIICS